MIETGVEPELGTVAAVGVMVYRGESREMSCAGAEFGSGKAEFSLSHTLITLRRACSPLAADTIGG